MKMKFFLSKKLQDSHLRDIANILGKGHRKKKQKGSNTCIKPTAETGNNSNVQNAMRHGMHADFSNVQDA